MPVNRRFYCLIYHKKCLTSRLNTAFIITFAIMTRKILIHILITFITTTGTLRAQQPILRNFSPAQYSGGTQNWCISQDASGRMFFANNTGLLMFDGDRWGLRTIANYTTVRAVLCDERDGVVYAGGTNEFGYYRQDSLSHTLRYHSLSAMLPEDEKGFGEIWAIHRWNSTIVFQGKDNLFLYGKSGKTVNIKEKHRIECSAIIGNRLVFSSKDGLYEVSGGKTRELPGTELMRGRTVRAIVKHGASTLFATSSGEIFSYDGLRAMPYHTDLEPVLREGQIFCAAANDSYVAFGTIRRGLILKNTRTGQVQYANISTGLQNNTVLSVMFDRQDNIWVGLDNGISYVVSDTPYHDLLGERNSLGTGYTSAVSGNRLYLGTNQGLFYVTLPVTQGPAPPRPQPVSGMAGQIWSLRGMGGRLLCGSDNGAYVVDGTEGRRIAGLDGTWSFCRLKRHPGYILAADYKGFCILKEGDGVPAVHSRLDGIAAISSGAMEEDDDGTIWIAHWQKGIYHVRLDSTLTEAAIIGHYGKDRGLLITENNLICRIGGRILVSAVDGFYRYDRKRDRLVYDKAVSEIFDTYGVPLRVYETPQRDLIAAKEHFLAVARHKGRGYEVDSISFRGIADRLQLSLGDIGLLDPHHCILNHDNGFYVIGDRPVKETTDNRLFIRRIASINDTDSTVYAAAPGTDSLGVALAHSMNSVRIEFVQPEYTGDGNVEYTCWLEGYDKTWGRPQKASYKEYTKLPKGKYIFHVRARNRVNGLTQETQIVIRIGPAWYETWWAFVLYMMAAAAVGRYIYKVVKRRADRELVRMKAEKERQLREQEIKLQMEKEKRKHQLAEMRNEQLDTELKHKQSQLSDSTMNLMRKNDMLQQIDEDMAGLSEAVRRGDVKAKLTKQIQEIRKNIQTNMKDDDSWEKFEENFNLVYDDFMKKLTARFPDLKTNDRKLCAYLRMGLSSKEMASLLNTPVRSIETARYRLRKKLNLDSGDNLTEFIQSVGDGGQE